MAALRSTPRTVRLREAASTIFALVALVPLLLLLYTLHRYQALGEPEAQLVLALALLLAILGYAVLQQMLGRLAHLATVVNARLAAPAAAPDATAHVAAVGNVAEIGQLGSAFAQMLGDLRASTDRLEDLVFKLGALSEVVELAERVPEIDDLLSLVLDRTTRTVRATGGSIMLIDHERQRLRVVATRGVAPAEAAAGCALGDGASGMVAQTGEAVITATSLCLPVRVEERIIGVINLVRQEGGFGPTDLQFLQTLIRHVAYSVDNARLLDETRKGAAELERALRDLQTAQTRLVEGETLRAMGQMASGMAHHLNNLLAIVSGRIQLLLMQVSETKVQRSLEIARQATEDAADVVRRVLEFTARQPVIGTSSADLNQLVREVVELTRPRWHDQAHLGGISIDVGLDLGGVPRVAGEVSGLREVLMNLVMNAVDAMPRGGRLGIRTWAEHDAILCAVSDTGVGMTEDVRRRAFEPFFTTKGPQGVGLGLSVAHAVIERHRGSIAIESASDRGTTVTFQLSPVDAEPAAPAGRPARRVIVVSLAVLLVDDEDAVRAALADSLAAHGHAVTQVSSGREALDRLEAGGAYDLVLTDLGMPGMTGWDLARVVRERWPDLALGLITGWGLALQATEEQRRSVDFIIAKPFTVEDLLQAIATASSTP